MRFSVIPGDPESGMSPMADMQFVPHARDQLITKMMPVRYDPEAKRPIFDRFITRILPDPEVRRFVQRWFALNTTALTGEQKLVFFYGLGANGKSVLVDLIARMFGDYAATARIETLTGSTKKDGSAATPDLVPLMLARMVRTSEPEEGEKLREADQAADRRRADQRAAELRRADRGHAQVQDHHPGQLSPRGARPG